MPDKPKIKSRFDETNTESLQPMLEVIASLLGRLVFPSEQLTNTIMKGKRNPEVYVKIYNICDGKHTLSQIADTVHITGGTLSPILSEWKEMGILYEITKKGGKFYKRLYKLDMPRTKKAKEKVAIESSSEQQTVPSISQPENTDG